MIELRVIDPNHFASGIRIDHVGVVGRDLPFGDYILVIDGSGSGTVKSAGTVAGSLV